MISAADRYENAALYSAVRCPVHQRVVALVDGRLAGKCDGCSTEAAQGLRRLRKMRSAS